MTYIQLNQSEISSINGGIVCAGLCVAAVFAGSFLVGAAVTIGVAIYMKEEEKPQQ
jgi:hypothetical protein